MRRFIALIALLSATFCLSSTLAQNQWRYVKEIKFPAADTQYVRPYLCTTTSTGRLYVISSNLTDVTARNMIFYADSNDVTFKKMVDYTATGDADTLIGNIGTLRGIASVGTDVLVNASVPYPRSKPNTVGTMYNYPKGDTAKVERFGYYFGSAGHGTFHNGVTLTKDTIAFAGVTAGAGVPGPRPRAYNFRFGLATPARGSWSQEGAQEPGGAHTGGFDVIRDVAVIPNGNYDDSTTVFYTSRNSYSSTQLSGGIAVWVGGRQTAASGYKGQRVQDPLGLLSLGTSISYGITVDKNKYLWVAGNDSTRRWVKAFDMSAGVFASEIYELPSKNSSTNPIPNGAPFLNPADVAVTPDGLTAYVIDATNRAAYQFKFGPPTDVQDQRALPTSFTLEQNFPNPFNPTTMISFILPKAMNVKLTVSNALGQHVATVVDGYLAEGKHVGVFDGERMPSGVYFYTLLTDDVRLTKKMTLLK